jgi:B9 domain-containing protein 1
MSDGSFNVVIHGVVEGAECLEAGVLYAKVTLIKGKDWSLATTASGDRPQTHEVTTQMSERLPGPVAKFSWNAPFELLLRSTNVHGWPQLGVAIMTVTPAGVDVAIAYARCHVPLQSGRRTIDIPLMQPVYSTPQYKLFGALTRTQPELRDISFLCTGDDRLMITAKRLPGHVRIALNVMINGLAAQGYEF